MLEGFDKLLKQFGELNSELSRISVTGESGTGMVKVTVNGKREVSQVQIDPTLLREQDRALLENLVAAAVNDASQRLERELRGKVNLLAGKLPSMPGTES